MGWPWHTLRMPATARTAPRSAADGAVTIESADPAMEPGAGLLAAMEAEIEALYTDRTGSMRIDSAAPTEEMSPPHGAFLLICLDGEPVACGGLKRLDDETVEIKRMYVVPPSRGQGLSRVLLEALEERARDLGYARVRLDTGDRQPAAAALYEHAGYRRIPDYNGNRLARFWFERHL
jgi:GNAT superfamily N-acetyltransferase